MDNCMLCAARRGSEVHRNLLVESTKASVRAALMERSVQWLPMRLEMSLDLINLILPEWSKSIKTALCGVQIIGSELMPPGVVRLSWVQMCNPAGPGSRDCVQVSRMLCEKCLEPERIESLRG